jgi:hypothetical protein
MPGSGLSRPAARGVIISAAAGLTMFTRVLGLQLKNGFAIIPRRDQGPSAAGAARPFDT